MGPSPTPTPHLPAAIRQQLQDGASLAISVSGRKDSLLSSAMRIHREMRGGL